MAKKKEAEAKFTNTSTTLTQAPKKDSSSGLVDFVPDLINSMEKDITNAGYDEKKSKSETSKFLRNIKPYKNTKNFFEKYLPTIIKTIGIKACDKINKDKNPDDDYTVKYNPSSKKIDVEGDDDIGSADMNVQFAIQNDGLINEAVIWLEDNVFSPLNKQVKLFIKTLNKQNKKSRKFWGHISKFANDEAITTLKAVEKTLENLKQCSIDDKYKKQIANTLYGG